MCCIRVLSCLAGNEALPGFDFFFNDTATTEIYTQLGQTDYAAEIALIREADPDSVFFFLPGGMGIAFVKQYAQSGLDVPLFGPAFSFDPTILAAVGEAALGVKTIGRASCRERVWQYVQISVGAVSLKKTTNNH